MHLIIRRLSKMMDARSLTMNEYEITIYQQHSKTTLTVAAGNQSEALTDFWVKTGLTPVYVFNCAIVIKFLRKIK